MLHFDNLITLFEEVNDKRYIRISMYKNNKHQRQELLSKEDARTYWKTLMSIGWCDKNG